MTPGLTWGNVPVPNTASWSAEEGLMLGQCPHFADAGLPAIVQRSAQGEGKPLFGSPQAARQRQVPLVLLRMAWRSLHYDRRWPQTAEADRRSTGRL